MENTLSNGLMNFSPDVSARRASSWLDKFQADISKLDVRTLQAKQARVAGTGFAFVDHEQSRIRRFATSVQIGGSIFVLGLMAMQAMAPLPAADLAARVALAGWALACFRLIPSRSIAPLAVHGFFMVLLMCVYAFGSFTVGEGSQLAIDTSLFMAGCVALAARWYLMFRQLQINSVRADLAIAQRRARILEAAAA